MLSATVPPARVGVWCACLLCSGIPAGTPAQLCRESAGIPAGNPPDWKNLAENLPDSKELTESQFFQGSRYPRNPENATPLKRNLSSKRTESTKQEDSIFMQVSLNL